MVDAKSIVNNNVKSVKEAKKERAERLEKISFLTISLRAEAIKDKKKEKKEMWNRYSSAFPESERKSIDEIINDRKVI